MPRLNPSDESLAAPSVPQPLDRLKLHSLFPPNTLVIDYGYPSPNPLRLGGFKRPLVYDGGMHVKGLKISTEFDDFSSSSDDDDDSISDINNSHRSSQPILRSSLAHDSADSFSHPEYPSDEINRKAIALFDFVPENDNEVRLTEGQVIWVSYRHGQGWLVAEDPETGENGLVPEAYVDLLPMPLNLQDEDDVPKRFLPEIFNGFDARDSDDEWEDTDFDESVADAVGKVTIHE